MILLLLLSLLPIGFTFPLEARGYMQPDIPTSIFGAVGIVAGLLLTIFGLRLMKPTLFISGYVFMMLVGIMLLARLEPAGGYQNPELVIMLGSSAMGLVGGLFALAFYRVGMSMLGATTGSLFAMFTLSFSPVTVMNSDVSRLIYILVFGFIGAILVHFAEAYVVMLTTSLFGSYVFIASVDIFAQTGLLSDFTKFITGQSRFTSFKDDLHVLLMLAAMLVLAIIGMVVQYRNYVRTAVKPASDESPRRSNGVFMGFDFRGQQRRRTFYKKTAKSSAPETTATSTAANAPVVF